MELIPSPAQQDIADSTAEYLSNEMPLSRVRELAARPGPAVVDDDTWREWASMGFFSLGLPDSAGGLGLGLVEEFLVAQQFGRHLTPGPVVSSTLATRVAHAAGLRTLASALLDGTARVGLRVGDIGYDAEPGGVVLSVGRYGAELHSVADLEPLESVDPTLRLSRLTVGCRLAHESGDTPQLHLWVLQSAMLLGLAEAAQIQSTEYAKVRRQFGRPIGSFQAVKHRCADMVTRCYAAGAQLHLAALHVEEDRPDARFQAGAALTLALSAAGANTTVNIQNHGGIGFTDEHDSGLMVKRAAALAAATGPEDDRLDAVTSPTSTVFA
jgi:alkylation response protein AidB-like acyl-CoA dehydrogenase